MKRPISILIAALGGEGGGVLAEWLVAMAVDAGYPAQSTSIPGVAQRTGATTYYIEIYPDNSTGRAPVLSLLPVPGCIDLLVASELLEAARNVQNGMASADRTAVVTSISRTLTTAEKVGLGDGRFDSGHLLEAVRENSRTMLAFDIETLTTGTAVSAVLVGAIAASGVLPFAREAYEAVIRSSGVGVEASLAGFARAMKAIGRGTHHQTAAHGNDTADVSIAAIPRSGTILAKRFPLATLAIVEAGVNRLTGFQDRAYADLYLKRLSRVLESERNVDATATENHALTLETARYLALWMAFDDIPRVADLKSRASRFARVHSEVAARDGDVVRIYDFFKPGIAEICAMLPAAIATPLMRWDSKRQAAGKPALALPLRVPAHAVAGFFVLRALAGLRRLRRFGSRYAEEQALIENWLAAIEAAAANSWALAYEIVLCGRLIKGYGATNERAKANLAQVLDKLAAGGEFATPEQRSAAIRAAREAALADEGGKALDRVLIEHGAPPRPVKAQPIRWSRRPAA